jgi:hypothetical protein
MADSEDVLREKLEALQGYAMEPQANRAALFGLIAERQGFVVGKAAEIIGEAGWDDAEAQLLEAYARFEVEPIKRDPGCNGKLALVDALNQLGCHETDVFRRAVRTRQLEPSWGPPVDTAISLRLSGAAGMARLSDSDFLFEAAALLNDTEPAARIGIVEVLDYFGGDGAELLLRMKVLAGDEDLEVMAECLAGLMRVNPERSLPVVAGFLEHAEAYVVESAALAIAESRSESAFLALTHHYEANRFEASAAAFLLPISLTRHEAAFDFLLDLIGDASTATALESLAALEIHAANEALVERIGSAVAERGEPELSDALRRRFDRAGA